jgi:hypothetical protein
MLENFAVTKTFTIFAAFIPTLSGGMGGTATYWKASLMLCFWLFERRKLKSCTKTNAEMNATGVVYTPGVCRGRAVPSGTLFGVHYILTGVGIQTLSVLSGRLPTAEIAEWAGEDTPLFVCRHR